MSEVKCKGVGCLSCPECGKCEKLKRLVKQSLKRAFESQSERNKYEDMRGEE